MGWLVGFYGISTFVGYLPTSVGYVDNSHGQALIVFLIWFGFMAYQPL